MKRTLMVLATSMFAIGSVSAADFQVWTQADKSGRNVLLSVSFIGDGVTQDAQIDLRIPAGFNVSESSVKMAGSVCAAFGDKGMIRAVPPSGAGKPLPSGLSDVCTFKLTSTGQKPAGVPQIEVAFKECGDPSGERSCGVQMPDVSER